MLKDEALMMAIENLQANSIWYEEDTNRDINLVCNAAKKVETLEAENARLREKQMPMEPTDKRYWHGGLLGAKCPNCQKIIGGYEKFCPNCGQAIKNDKE